MEGVDDYARARWNDLVRTLLHLGADVAEAEAAAHDALVRSWEAWPREARFGDVDVLVYGELLEAWSARSRAAGGSQPDPDDVARVLVAGAELEEHQAESLTGSVVATGRGPGTGPWSPARRHEDWEARYGGAAPLASLHEAVRRARRRRRGLVAGAAAVVAALALAAVVLPGGAPPDDGDPDRPDAANGIPLAWWADGVLHLGTTTVEAPGLVTLAQSGDDPTYAVVYTDSAGQVVQVSAGGDGRRIGTTDAGAPVLGASAGRVVWVDVGDDRASSRRLVLWDPAVAAARSTLDLAGSRAGPGAALLAVEAGEVLLRTADGRVEAWRPGEADTRPSPGATTTATGAGRTAGRSDLSPSGRFVATWEADGPALRVTTAPGQPGTAQTADLQVPGSQVLDARFVDDRRLVVVSTQSDLRRSRADSAVRFGRFPMADLVVCETVSLRCVIAQSRVREIDPGTATAAIILPG